MLVEQFVYHGVGDSEGLKTNTSVIYPGSRTPHRLFALPDRCTDIPRDSSTSGISLRTLFWQRKYHLGSGRPHAPVVPAKFD
jgi:hypothetical protein